MKAKVNLNLDCEVLEHGSILVPLYIVCAFTNNTNQYVQLAYFVDEAKAQEHVEFCKRTYSYMYHNFWIQSSYSINL